MESWLPIIGWTLGFGLTVASLGYAIQHFRISSAMSYIQRMNSSDMVEIRSAVNRWLEGPGTDAEKFEEAEGDPVLNAKLRIFIDILTELGIAYRYKAVSRRLVREIWYPFIPDYWLKLQFYVYGRQVNGARTGYWLRYLAEEIATDAAKRERLLERRYRIPTEYVSAATGQRSPTSDLRKDVSEGDRALVEGAS